MIGPCHRRVTSRIEAWAGLAEDIGAALQVFGGRLRESSVPAAGRLDAPAASAEDGLGPPQLRVLAAVRDSGERGVTSPAVAKATGTADSNTPRISKALADRRLIRGGHTKGSPINTYFI